MTQLYWHCAHCGGHEPAHPPYVEGDREKCIDCGKMNYVVTLTLQRAAQIEQAAALGRPPRAGDEVTP